MTRRRLSLFHIVRAATAVGLVAVAGVAVAREVPPTTPEGVTLVEVMRELPISQPEILWLRPGDAQGRTLFVYDQDDSGKSNCRGECAREFVPFLAPRGAEPSGDWSLTPRPDGARQWAYQSRPLYTWVKEQTPGEVATNVGLTETANSKFAEDAVQAGELLPPEGWTVARFEPAASRTLPIGIDVRLVYSAQAVALTDSEGFTLYMLDEGVGPDDLDCTGEPCDRWHPLVAPALASSVGDFSIVTRRDGVKQWAFQGRPLFTYELDRLPGDAHGRRAGESLSIAALTRNFLPSDVDVGILDGYGASLTVNGMTLYGAYSFEKRWGGRNLRDTFTNVYYKGKRLGGAGCVSAQCLANWRPLEAPADAKPNGLWEPITRDDGGRQWAYKGYALYTYSGDQAPGQHNGQATYDFAAVEGDERALQRVGYLQDISGASGGVGIYWNIAKP